MINEIPFFFDNMGSKLFGFIHEPENYTDKAIVFCHSFAEEKLWSHRVYVSLARKLVEQGYIVMRYDYRGYGDSDGDFKNCSIESYFDDISRAVSYLKSKYSDLSDIGLFGHRLGASLAVLTYDDLSISGPLVLWDPIIDGEKYMQEFLRSHLSTQLAIYNEIRETRDQLIENMKQGNLVNVEGYDLSYLQYSSISKLDLKNCKIENDVLSLIIQSGRNNKPKSDIEELCEILNCELLCVQEEPFYREIKRFYSEAKNMNAATIEWLGNING